MAREGTLGDYSGKCRPRLIDVIVVFRRSQAALGNDGDFQFVSKIASPAAAMAAERVRRATIPSRKERAVRMRVGVGAPRVCVLAWAAAREKLGLRWGPEQVAGAALPGLAISASTIRRRIKADWTRQRAHLRRRGKPYLSRAERRAQSRNRIPNRVHFSQHPPQADARAQPGHWEMDTLLDPGACRRAGALILADRATRQIALFPLPRVSARAASARLRQRVVRSITADHGGKFAQHARITQATAAPIFFTDPHAPQQRGTCENAVALVRDRTRGKRLGSMTPTQLRAIAERINQRPMKTHQWRSRNQAAKRL